MGGEKQIGGDNGLDKQGSPPRGRGKVDSLSRQLTGSGITPAWAGKSKEPLKICEKQEDHPRVGGEKLDLLAVVFSALGSPPRGRGKDVDWLGFNQFFRITPAWAGKSYSCCPIFTLSEDHPRVGGEKPKSKATQTNATGSPPRGRGKAPHGQPSGISARDHPRVGGEKKQYLREKNANRGSPPRGRGKVS